MSHPVHPKCPACQKSLYKAFEKGKPVKKTDPWDFCRNSACRLGGPEGIATVSKAAAKRALATARVPTLTHEEAVRLDAEAGRVGPEPEDDTEAVEDELNARFTKELAAAKEAKEVRFQRRLRIYQNRNKPKDVHTEHCCKEHGCKYDDEDCPVVQGKKEQSFPCESCDDDARAKKAAAEVAPEKPVGRKLKRRAIPASEAPRRPEEPEAVRAAREQLKPIIAMLAPSSSPPASIGLVLALVNQGCGAKSAANVLIDEFELDKKYGIQRF